MTSDHSAEILPPAFDADFYRTNNPELSLDGHDDALFHYASHGRAEGLVASPLARREAMIDLVRSHDSVLEIGPFCRPLISGEGVEYLDVLDAAALRRRATELGLDPTACPAVIHYVGSLKQIGRRYDAVISSHSIEHQPDLVRHLEQVSRILEDDGRYYIIIPDKRFCFDHFLPESSIADVLEAYREARQVHSLASVIEHGALVTHNDASRHWNGDHGPDTSDDLSGRVLRALRRFDESDGNYIDVHAWQFTPQSFRLIVEALAGLGLCSLDIEEIYDTPRDRQEFCVVLRKRRKGRLSPIPQSGRDIVFLQTADAFRYAPMLAATSATVIEYCRRNGFQYESFIGLKRGFWNWQATYNRIIQLKELLDGGFRGWAIYLDADAYIHDLSFDLSGYLADKDDHGAIFATSGVTGEHWDVNAGVAFINFAHASGRQLVERWWAAFERIDDERLRAAHVWLDADNDQDLLHQLLRSDGEIARSVLVESMDFINSRHAQFIRQHLRAQTSNMEARIRSIVSEVRTILHQDGAPSAIAASEMLPFDQQERTHLFHPIGLEPRLIERPPATLRPDLAERAIEAWRAATVHRDPSPHQADFVAALNRADVADVAAQLAQLGRSALSHGFFGGTRQYRLWTRDPAFARARALRTYDALLSLAEMVGAVALESPDVGGWGDSARTSPADLFAMIQQRLGVDLTPPTHVGGYLGIEAGNGVVLHLRMIEAIYAAWRLCQWAALLGANRILQLNGGAGWTALYAHRLGLRTFRIVDEPAMTAVQAFVLGDIEGMAPPRPIAPLAAMPAGSFDMLVNEDTLPELPRKDALDVLDQARRTGVRAFLSLNREASGKDPTQHATASQIAAEVGFQPSHRQRHGLRPGFAEELFLLRI